LAPRLGRCDASEPLRTSRTLQTGNPHFRTHGGGKIINVAGRAAHRRDAPDQWPYAASKGAPVALTKTITCGNA